MIMSITIDASLVKCSDWLLKKILRGKWRRGSNQPMRSWYFRKHYGYLLDEYKVSVLPTSKNDGPIWMFWWQGVESMPPIVRKCYDLAVAHAPQAHPVVLLTKENFTNYVQIPEYILKKVELGVITLTHFSDILRMALLYEHGGLWMDATLYSAATIPEKIFSQVFFCSYAQGGRLGIKMSLDGFLHWWGKGAPIVWIRAAIVFRLLERP